jgi:uncharacterized membrane protein
MQLNLYQFDIFGFIGAFFILVFVIAIIFFIIVILVVYKLLHSNVDNVQKKRVKPTNNLPVEIINNKSKEIAMDKMSTKEILSTCKYCGENMEEKAIFCPYCGSNLSV